MSILLVDPVGEVASVAPKAVAQLAGLQGRRVGFVFNGQIAAQAFWSRLEREVQATLAPTAVERLHKDNTYAPIPQEAVARMVRQTDYALVGVGA